MRTFLTLVIAIGSMVHLKAQVLSKANEMTVRNGLPNFFEKVANGEEIRVAYLGGSITAANGWRVKSLKWLKEQYPEASFSEINAAIGGTGSNLGVFRLEQDVLSHKPDLLFVEFAVNDGSAPADRIQRAMEGIVRQTWSADPATDICFIYTLAEPMLLDYKEGNFPASARAMESVADHYKIPSISFGPEVAKQVTDSSLIFTGKADPAKPGQRFFTDDAVHPNDTGHDIYQEVVARNLTAMKDQGKGGPHKFAGVDPLRADNWENARIIPITRSMLKGKWTKLDATQPGLAKRFQNRLPELWKAEAPGASIEFALEGTVAQIYGLYGPDGGELEIQVDEEPTKKHLLFDQYSTYHRLVSMSLVNVAAVDRYAVRVALTGNMPDKEKILSEGNRIKMRENPEPYTEAVWYVGSLLILGDVAE